MRFLNISLRIPEKKIEADLPLSSGGNIIYSENPYIREVLYNAPFIALYGKTSGSGAVYDLIAAEEFSVRISAENGGEKMQFSCENGDLKQEQGSGIISYDDSALVSFFTPQYEEDGTDPAINGSTLKNFLVNIEAASGRSSGIHQLSSSVAEREKKIHELKKSRELLELKKRKKDKLVKELSLSEREMGRLRRKRESYYAYRGTLTALLDLIQEESKLSSKIVNIKKDIIDIRETAEKCEALENEIANRFPQFTAGMIEIFPDLDRLQGEFNAIRDINEEMDKFDAGKKRKSSLALKGITGGLLFAFISMMFILFKSIPLNSTTGILLGGLSSLLVLLSAATGYYLYLLTRESYPEDLINRKKTVESGLLEIFSNGNFPNRDFGTGELYEYLFQYFQDFLSFRDLQNELSLLKKGTGSRVTLKEREGKLTDLTDKKASVEKEIEAGLASLDINIHPSPDREGIKEIIPEIDEMISELEREEAIKRSVAEKIEGETRSYESGDFSGESIDASLEGIDAEIDSLNREIDGINFMRKVYDETSEQWFSENLPGLADRCGEIYRELLSLNGKPEKFTESIKDLILTGKKGALTSEEISAIALSMKIALGGILPDAQPPLVLNDPFTCFSNEITGKLKKILLELSEKRQVVIITSNSITDLAGNLINI